MMLNLLKDLIRHKAYANAAMLRAIRQYDKAANDLELQKLLHHILLANRYWLLLILGLPFQAESQIPESLGAIAVRYRETHEQEFEWISRLQEDDLERRLESPFIPGVRFTVGEALMQVCLHSQGHRAQCSTRLRLLGGSPPSTEFITWLVDQPAPDWS
jgi:uncharacterized damage-inducible protein DinB